MKKMEKRNSLLSVVAAAYNEEEIISDAAETIHAVLGKENIQHEILFVDDGSKDRSWEIISRLAEQYDYVKGIRFSRNFGKESAITAGLRFSSGGACAVMDCDLQHPPEKLVEMYRLWQEGYEVIEGQKSDRGKESAAHRFAAKTFYSLISRATGVDMSKASDFKLLDKKAVDALLSMRERNAFFRALSSWIGFRSTAVPFEVRQRKAGASKWSTRSLIRYAIGNITSFSTAPMRIITLLGVIMLITTLIFGGISLVQKILGVALGGFTTVILLLLFIGSIMMISLGIIGYYIAKIYDEIKDRPRYIVSEFIGEGVENETDSSSDLR